MSVELTCTWGVFLFFVTIVALALMSATSRRA